MALPTLIQHVSGSPLRGSEFVTVDGFYEIPLPNLSLAGNCLICSVAYDHSQSPTVSVSDDKGNAWTLGASGVDAGNTATVKIFYALNVAAGTSVIHVNFTNFANGATHVAVMASEFNNVATASAADGSSGNVATSSTVTAGSFTPAVNGDLIYQYATVTSGTITSWTQGSDPWRLLSADYNDQTVAQWQVQTTAASINPTLTASSSVTFASAAIALKSASAGTSRPAGIRILRLQHINTQNETAATVQFQFPCTDGNLLVVAFSSGAPWDLASIADSLSNTWTHTGGVVTSDPIVEMFHSANATMGTGLSITCTMSGSNPTGHGGTFFIYEIVGAASSPLDTSFGTSGFAGANGDQTQGGAGGPVTTFTATPGGQNELIIVVGSNAYNTATGWSSPSGARQIPTTYSGEPNPTNCDENNPAGIFYNGASVSSQTWIYTHNTIDSPGSGPWAVGGAAFVAGAGGAPPAATGIGIF